MMKLVTILFMLFSALLVSCIPQDRATEVTCNPGSSFDPVKRECIDIKIIREFSLNEEETKRFLIDSAGIIVQAPVRCDVITVNRGIAVDCLCARGSCYATVSPDPMMTNGVANPAYPNFFGQTDFIIRLFDGSKYSNNVWVNVTVNNLPDGPVVTNQIVNMPGEGLAMTVALDAMSPDNLPLTYDFPIDSYGQPYGMPDHGEATFDQNGNFTIDYSVFHPNNDMYDTNFDGTDRMYYTVSDGTYSASGIVEINILNPDEDAPVIIASEVTAEQDRLSADTSVAEDATFTVNLPFAEFDSGQRALECKVTFNDPNGKIEPVGADVPVGSNGCRCVLAPPAYTTYSCSVEVSGTADQYGQTQLEYAIQTGSSDPLTHTWTPDQTLVFDLNEVNDRPRPQRDEVRFPGTESNLNPDPLSPKMGIYFEIPAATNVDSEGFDPSASFTYNLTSAPGKGSVSGCITTGVAAIDRTVTCQYFPDDTTALGYQWREAYLDLQELRYTTIRKGLWGNNITVEIKEMTSISAGTAQVSANLFNRTILILVNSSGGTEASDVKDALEADENCMSLVSVDYIQNPLPTTPQIGSGIQNLENGTNGLDFISYSVTDSKGSTSLYDGVVYLSSTGINQELGIVQTIPLEFLSFIGDESSSNLPIPYIVQSGVDVTYAGKYQFLETGPIALGVNAGEDFDSSCLTSLGSDCVFTPVDGDVQGTWSAAKVSNGEGINFTARRLGTIGNSIGISTISSGDFVAGNEFVSVSGFDITIDIELGVTTNDQVQAAIQDHPVASGLVQVDLTLSGVVQNISFPTFALGDGTAGTDGVAYVHYYYSAEPNINQLGILYINLLSEDEDEVKFFDAPTLCHYGSAFDYPECGEEGCIGEISPIGAIAPSKAGIYFYRKDIPDITPGTGLGAICYRSTGTSNTDWEIVQDKNLYLGANYRTMGDITYFAKVDDLTYTVILAPGATAGAEIVTLYDQTITISIEDGVSTAQQIKDALDNSTLISLLLYTYIGGDSTASQSMGTAILDQSSGDTYAINENDVIHIKRIRLDEGDGLDILNSLGSYESQCNIFSVESSDPLLVPPTNSNLSIEYNGIPYAYIAPNVTQIFRAGISYDSTDMDFKVIPASGHVGSSFVHVTLQCSRPDEGHLNTLTPNAAANIPCANGAWCTGVESNPNVTIIFKVTVKEAGIAHNGWKNIMALGPKVNKDGHSLDSCPYDTTGCSTGICIGRDRPAASIVVPERAGLFYYDQNSSHCYISTGTTSADWVDADCSSSYSYDEPACNGSATTVDQCIGDASPVDLMITPTKLNSLFYDKTAQKCYRSTNTGAVSDWTVYLRSATVTFEWEDFTYLTPGQYAEGFNVYRRLSSESNFDYERPINKVVIGSSVKKYTDNIKNSWQAPVPGTVYSYEVRPIINGIATTGGSTTYQEIRVTVPPPNMAFLPRRIVNKSMCESMGKIPDRHNDNRCEYNGPGANAYGFYDIGSDYLVDRFEQGCPYTSAPACGRPSTGCIGTVSPSGNVAGALNDVYYDRSTAKCYVYNGGWNDIASDALRGKLASSLADTEANVYVSRMAHLPPLTNIDQETANNFCQERINIAGTDIVGSLIIGGPNIKFELPNRKEQIGFGLWNSDDLDDVTITALEHGLDLDSSAKCNSSAANGLDASFVNTDVPSVSVAYTLPGTENSIPAIRSFYTGSSQTETCVSRFGIQDVVGNVTEWTRDRLFCPSPYVCEFLANEETDGTAHISSFGFEGAPPVTPVTSTHPLSADPQFFSQWSFSPSMAYCHDNGGADVDCFSGGAPINQIVPGAVGVRYLDVDTGILYRSNGTTNTDWADEFTLKLPMPALLSYNDYDAYYDNIWVTPNVAFNTVFSYIDGNETNDSQFGIFRFDGRLGPCMDNDASESCNGELTEWYIPTPDTVYSNRVFVPVGLPVSSNINLNAWPGSDLDLASEDALRMNSSGILASKLHNDHIQIYSQQIFDDANACGSMLGGGSFQSADKAGVYSSQFTPCSTPFTTDPAVKKPASSAVGFRCLGKINY